MKRKIFKSNVNELIEEGRNIMDATIDSRFYNRVAAVNAVLSGVSPTQAAGWFGMTGRSLTGWVKKVDEQGFSSLKDKPRQGAPSKLSATQLEEIDKILQSSPADYSCKVWDGPTLSSIIKQKYGTELSTRQCQRLFHKLGYSRVRPQTYPSKDYEQTEARVAFQKKERVHFKKSGPGPCQLNLKYHI